MQKFLGLTVTGKLDPDTLTVMRKPRCGVPDVGAFSTFPHAKVEEDSPHLQGCVRRKYYLLQLFSLRIVDYTPDLPRDAVDSAVEKALRVWEEVTPLTFSRMCEGEADIMITFAVREHGDMVPFDGPGMVLAHACPPRPGLMEMLTLMMMNNGQRMHQGPIYSSLLLMNLAIPWVSDYNSLTDLARFRLPQDDVNGIQSLYGPLPASPHDPVEPTESASPETPAMCDPTLSFNAISTLRGEILFFKDRSDQKITFSYLFLMYNDQKGKTRWQQR
ncbi:hypothetical protein QTO34_004074 [Cnephaeus nilssonii]|uniref:Peptidase metallopeptidase domain-containing protein n=1 Tax=Cnephaeus nilssonii TaxID=3371016 RepID=A0AA40LLY7_CNENI|nr:hypothetical protein QTO34_004074 [Eptesicus nilssonii]